jgi:hypothetical protein
MDMLAALLVAVALLMVLTLCQAMITLPSFD